MVQYRICIPLRIAIDMIDNPKVGRYRINLSSIGDSTRYVEMYCSVGFIKITVGMIPEAAKFVLVRLPDLIERIYNRSKINLSKALSLAERIVSETLLL